MKAFYSILFSMLLSGYLYAQRLGINTTQPTHPLTIKADHNQDLLGLQNSSGLTKWHWWMPGGSNLVLTESGIQDYRLTIESGGNVGIGVADPLFRLDINGNARISNGLQLQGDLIAQNKIKLTSFSGTGNRNIGTNSAGELIVMPTKMLDAISNAAPENYGQAPMEIYDTEVDLQAGPAMVMFSGSAYRANSPGLMRMRVRLYQVAYPHFSYQFYTEMYVNEMNVHHTFPTAFKSLNLLYGGTYIVSIHLEAGGGVTSHVDFNDRFNVSIIQF